MTDETSTTTSHRELTVTRVFDAPRESVFRAWTEPAQFAHMVGRSGDNNVHADDADGRTSRR